MCVFRNDIVLITMKLLSNTPTLITVSYNQFLSQNKHLVRVPLVKILQAHDSL